MHLAKPTAHVLELGRRIELVSMDKWLSDITIGLYRMGDPPHGVIHSYSRMPGAAHRVEWLTRAMSILGGLEADEPSKTVWFGCGTWHELAVRRAFLEACKVDPTERLMPRTRQVEDPRSSQTIEVEPLGAGAYVVRTTGGDPGEASRAPAIAAGLAKLLEIDIDPQDRTKVRFGCRNAHDDLAGLLLMRAINVRATLRELEAAATRGILVAPSAQEGATPA